MKGKKKVLLGLFFALLLVVGATAITFAYFTQTTATKDNVFTVGKVEATLTEPLFDQLTAEEKVLVPGRVVEKDPTLTIKANSEEVYARVFVKIDTNFYNLLDSTKGLPTANTDWTLNATTTSGDYTILEYRYDNAISKASTDTQLPTVFDNVGIVTTATGTQLSGISDATVQVVGQIIQTEGFADASAAFTAAGRPAGF